MMTELELRQDFFGEITEIDTIYFGGGTPSILNKAELGSLLDSINKYYTLSSQVELCLEANPDDLNKAYLNDLKSLNINRLSIGIQSLNDNLLSWMNRSHTAKQAIECVHDAANAGFDQLNVDLIYGVPGLDPNSWKAEVEEVLALPVQHLSAYSLTLEEKTAYSNFVKKHRYLPPDEDLAVEHYWLLNELIEKYNWEQYEVSNYCKERAYSKHNTSYWRSQPYLGIGPSAHSFNGTERYWNVRSNAAYISALSKRELKLDMEKLSYSDKVNEYIMTGLRTKWGISSKELRSRFGLELSHEQLSYIDTMVEEGKMYFDGDLYKMSKLGMLFSDAISSTLFIDHSSHTSS